MLIRLVVAVMVVSLVEKLLPSGQVRTIARWALGLLLLSTLADMISQVIAHIGA